jgi:hypothetical protein
VCLGRRAQAPGLGVASLKHLRAHVALKCAFAGAGVNKKGGGGKGGGNLRAHVALKCSFAGAGVCRERERERER